MKVTIVGTGQVGSSLAYVTVLEGLAEELVLINRNRNTAEGHARDLQHTASLVRHPIRVRAGDVQDSKGSDVVVVTVSVPMDRETPDRRALAKGNAELLRTIIPPLAEANPDAVFLIITNPVDVMTWAVLQLTDLPWQRVCGIGTIVDSARFRAMLSQELNIHPDDIRAYIIGEHGASQVAAISVASVAGVRFQESIDKAREYADATTSSGIEIFQLKGYTNFAVAKATALVIEAVQHDQQRTMPLSISLGGYCDIEDLCLSIPVVMARNGITRTLHPQLTEEEKRAFEESADAIRQLNHEILPILQGK